MPLASSSTALSDGNDGQVVRIVDKVGIELNKTAQYLAVIAESSGFHNRCYGDFYRRRIDLRTGGGFGAVQRIPDGRVGFAAAERYVYRILEKPPSRLTSGRAA